MEPIHATCIALNGKGVLLRGRSGSGKSDLALRLIERGARLVADDLVELSAAGAPPGLVAKIPSGREEYRGILEIRGIGLMRLAYAGEARLDLVADLDENYDRMPSTTVASLLGVELRRIALNAFEASAPAKIHAALTYEMADG